MKRVMILFTIIIIAIGLYWMSKLNFANKQAEKSTVDVAFFGDEKYKQTFDQSVVNGGAFSELFEAGLNSKKAGDYATAIRQLNECLPLAALGPEVAMVYKQLIEIYRDLGDLEKELFYLEEIPKYTMSDRIKKESAERSDKIRQLLMAK
jgi:tetratricopeptide (TPR) repeat protein